VEDVSQTGAITRLLSAARDGDRDAADRLFALVYRELRQIAHRQLGGGGDSLRTTDLVHETYLKLAQGQAATPRDRGHFFAVAARAMRQILVDHARRRVAQKRGAGLRPDLRSAPTGSSSSAWRSS